MTGPAFVLAFVVLSAFRDVFFADALRSAPFFAVALIAFSTCTAAFLLVALCERERTLRVVLADWPAFLLMNLFTAVAWLQYFQSLRLLEPAIAHASWLALVPAAFVFMAVPIYFNQIGVKRASPLTVRVLLALGPVFLIA